MSLGLIVRPMVSGDLPYVARSWLMSLTERDGAGKRLRGYQRRRAYEAAMPRVAALLERCAVWCAIHPDAPDTIHGFVVREHSGHTHFLFVPRLLRHQGIELLLHATAAQPAGDTTCVPESPVSSSNLKNPLLAEDRTNRPRPDSAPLPRCG